jgi:hypothetical protein
VEVAYGAATILSGTLRVERAPTSPCTATDATVTVFSTWSSKREPPVEVLRKDLELTRIGVTAPDQS